MTPKEIDAMPAGRELDALVAEKVMGLALRLEKHHDWGAEQDLSQGHYGVSCRRCYTTKFTCGTEANALNKHEPPPPECEPNVPGYSTSIAAAWGVLEKAFEVLPGHKSGFPAVIRWADSWRVTLLDSTGAPIPLAYGGRLLLARAETAPLRRKNKFYWRRSEFPLTFTYRGI